MALRNTLQMLKRSVLPAECNLRKILMQNSSIKLSTSIENPGKVVFISQSTDVYANLALEDWLYKNWDFTKRHLLLLWRNTPCVVIGRHQNPYIEANLPYLESADIPVVRRNSGGGTVYHDSGNLNCSFFTPREVYDRKKNLELICNSLKQDFDADCKVNKNDDIVIKDELKISGTAAKLGRLNCYHHCTLLISSDKYQMKLALNGDKSLKSKATASIRSSVANLQELCPDLSVERVLATIGEHYLRSGRGDGSYNYYRSDGFTLVNPTEEWFPGLGSLKDKLVSADWFYGMTPLFQIARPVPLMHSLNEGSSVLVTLEVYQGVIKSVKVSSKVSAGLQNHLEEQMFPAFVGQTFSSDVFNELESKIILENSIQHSFQ